MGTALRDFPPELLVYGVMVAEIEKIDPDAHQEIKKRFDDIMIPHRKTRRKSKLLGILSFRASDSFNNSAELHPKDGDDEYKMAGLRAVIGYLQSHAEVAKKLSLHPKTKDFCIKNLNDKTLKELKPYLGL